MLNDRLEKYITDACSRIVNPKKRKEVYEELMGHIEDKWEFYASSSMSEEEITRRILNEMGSNEYLSETLGLLHSHIPPKDLKSAISKMFWGFLLLFLLPFITYSISGNFPAEKLRWIILLDDIKLFIYSGLSIILFIGIRQLRKNNRVLMFSYYYNIIYLILWLCEMMARITSFSVTFTTLTFLITLGRRVIFWFFGYCFFKGIREMILPDQEGLRLKLLYARRLFIIANVFPQLGILFFYSLRQIRNVQRYFWFKQIHAKTEEVVSKDILAAVAMVAVFTVLPLTASYIVSHPLVQSEPFKVLADESDQELLPYEQIRQSLSEEYDIPEFIVDDLPEEELAEYQQIIGATISVHNETVDGGDLEVYNIAFDLDGKSTRFLYYFIWRTPPSHALRDAIAMPGINIQMKFSDQTEGTESSVLLSDQTEGTDRIVLLYDQNNISMEMKPASIHYITLNDAGKKTDFICKFDFRIMAKECNQRGFIAATRIMDYQSEGIKTELGNISLTYTSSPSTYYYLHRIGTLGYPYSFQPAMYEPSFAGMHLVQDKEKLAIETVVTETRY